MDFLSDDIQKYIEAHSTKENELLKDLDRQTHLKVMMPRMLSGQVQGRFLSFLSQMIRPKRILEIGTYTGYATICLSEGLLEDGEIITIDKNEELKTFTQEYFDKAGISKKVNFIIGNAMEEVKKLTGIFDIIFIDADKANYSNYYDICLPLLAPEGYMIADNVLWSGKVLEGKPDKNTKAIQVFNKKVQEDPAVENVLLSVRDGLMLIRRK